MTSPPSIPSYSRSDLLSIAVWWGLFAGFSEGVYQVFEKSPIWSDLMRTAVMTDPVLFGALALIILAVRRSKPIHRELLVRSTLGFSFLAAYVACDALVPRLISPFVFFIISLGVAAVCTAFFYLHERTLHFQKKSLVFLAGAALCFVVAVPLQQHMREARELGQLPQAAPGARNVLVIVVDTLRADHLSTYGYSRPTSSNLTSIAHEGVVFENAIAPSSWTLPVHASMLTGLYPHDHHAIGDRAVLGSGYHMLGEALEAQGYRTAAFSGNTIFFTRQHGFGRGFIHFEDDFQSWGNTFPKSFYVGRIANHLCQLGVISDWPGRKTAEEVNRHALRWIDSNSRPFFVFLNYYDVHDPYRPPEPYLRYYSKLWNSKQSKWFRSRNSFCKTNDMDELTPEQRVAAMDAYDGAINYVDDQIAELMRELKKRGLLETTTLIITSDHGEGFYEHGTMNHATSLYRELIHVPLIIRGAGQIPVGKKVHEPVSLVALPATVLDLVGDSAQPLFSETSLSRLWTDGGPPSTSAAPISELAQLRWNPKSPEYYGPMKSVTTSEWHYITGGNSGEQLFRCCDNSSESVNLASTAEGKQVCQQFRQELQMVNKPGVEQTRNQARQLVNESSPGGVRSASELGELQ